MKTPEEIKNGLKCCLTSCKGCPYNDPTYCGSALVRDAITYIRQLEDRPPMDAEPVRHGKWIEHLNYMEERDGYYWCPLCQKMATREYNYCPNCGAKMDLEGSI